MSEKLKPCPFCGEVPTGPEEHPFGYRIRHQCDFVKEPRSNGNGGSRFSFWVKKEDLIKSWNTRGKNE